MLALDAKRGVEATLERVYNSTRNSLDKLKITWSGRTAGVCRSENGDVHVVFPGIDETKQVDNNLFNQLIGYALHELGHLWFTTDRAWDKARKDHGAYVSALINGLEDPRIERCVIESGYAPNSRALFEHLTNQILTRDGYVEPDDFKNIPFLLAVEGRRLNGYNLVCRSIVDKSPYAKHLRWALKAAHNATDTPRIVKIAIELYKRLKQQQEQEQQQPEQQQEQQPEQSSEPPNSDGEGQGQGEGDEGDSGSSDKPEQGQPGDGQPGDDGGNQPGDQPGDEPSESPGNGGGWSDEVGRPVEPDDYIARELQSVASTADERRPRPHAGKPIINRITFV
jgi:hypothetical protein